ncbi:kinase-like protein [Athelia psychrophila]|uniref:Kinase-like protein n=1 Tax=Athelia psychrophila TaxID=1759441 RepID=A0A166WBA0_9AGAM|nr:kinase-like protein [Fibularhizoctonia sp. CBS 109695]
MKHSTLLLKKGLPDSLENYIIQDCIGQGATSSVYVAICNKGRLRDRKLAIKKRESEEHADALTTLHLSLHHPAIVSMFSAFLARCASYEVMELCPRGSLFGLLNSRYDHCLSEPEIRGALKSLVDALMYLRNERVLHRDIKPENVLITEDGRVKLSNFGLATRLPSASSAISISGGSPNYVSPEMALLKHYSFPTDVWSLGCVVLTCLTGSTPFEAEDAPAVLDKVCTGSFTLPLSISTEARNLISSLLRTDVNRRMGLDSILKQSFFCRDSMTITIQQNPATSKRLDPSQPRLTGVLADSNASCRAQNQQGARMKENISPRQSGPDPCSDLGKRKSSIALSHKDSLISDLERTQKTPSLIDDRGSSTSTVSVSVSESPREEPGVEEKPYIKTRLPVPKSGLFSQTHMNRASSRTSLTSLKLHFARKEEQKNRNSEKENANLQNRAQETRLKILTKPPLKTAVTQSIKTADEAGTQIYVPIGMSRPTSISVSSLRPQTHKIAHGQLTILQSRSLLIDFREGERRKGNKGREVLLVNMDGSQIEVHSAPHLSSPCCLVEPTAAYPISMLPAVYWKQYADAGRAIEQVKRKAPQVVFFNADSKCTLMSNKPQADIEIIYPSNCSSSRSRTAEHGHASSTRLRIRLSRQQKTLEISRFIASEDFQLKAGEWTTKTFNIFDGLAQLCDQNSSHFDDIERSAMNDLREFVTICEAVEVLPKDHLVLASSAPVSSLQPHDLDSQSNHCRDPGATTSTCTTKISTLGLTQCPPKLLQPLGRPTLDIKESGDGWKLAPDVDLALKSQSRIMPTESLPHWSRDEFSDEAPLGDAGIQTRFLPSVGWCMRYGGIVSQGGRYRIMFLDGVTLDIDVDEEYAEFKSLSGDVTRHRIGEFTSKRKVSERMKMFQEFVSMFEDHPHE